MKAKVLQGPIPPDARANPYHIPPVGQDLCECKDAIVRVRWVRYPKPGGKHTRERSCKRCRDPGEKYAQFLILFPSRRQGGQCTHKEMSAATQKSVKSGRNGLPDPEVDVRGEA